MLAMLVEVLIQHSVQKQRAFLIRLALAVYRLQIKETDGLYQRRKTAQLLLKQSREELM